LIVPLFNKRKTIDGVKKLKRITRSTVLILETAESLGIKWEKINYTDLFKLSYQNEVKYFHAQVPSTTTEFAYYCCNNKRISKNLLEQAGLSVSKGYLIKTDDSQEYRLSLFADLQKPVVVKPVDDFQGRNVYLNLKTAAEFLHAGQEIYDHYGQKKVDLLVEQMFFGDEYRILATREKILSVIKRLPANVTGDGVSTIEALINLKNHQPIRQKIGTYNLIEVDDQINTFLKNQQFDLQTILPIQKTIFLRPHSSLDISLGGDTIDVTDQIHPSVAEIVQKIMNCVPGLALTGIDYMTKDIQSQQTTDQYVVVEINSSPSLDWNEFPLQGPHRHIAFEFLKIMFPNLVNVEDKVVSGKTVE